MGESSLQIASMQPRTVLSRAKCENGALTKIVRFVTGRKGVMDGERQKMNTSLWRREGGQQHSILWGLTSLGMPLQIACIVSQPR